MSKILFYGDYRTEAKTNRQKATAVALANLELAWDEFCDSNTSMYSAYSSYAAIRDALRDRINRASRQHSCTQTDLYFVAQSVKAQMKAQEQQ